MTDCAWIGDLARHGLIARSFVPPRPIRDLRDLTRYRRKLSQVQAAERNRLIKLLESANIKLSGVVSDVFGVSGRAMLQALIEGEQSAAEMAQLARARMRRKHRALELALNGSVDEHHRFVLRLQFARIKAAEADLERLDERLREKLAPYAEPVERLMQMPGVDWVTAATIIAEVGVDPRIKCPGAGMSAFNRAAHLASWTGLCPGNHQSAGKQRTGKTRKGNVHLKTALITAAITGCRTRGTYLADKHRCLLVRRGKMRAAVAIAHKILLAVYHMLATGSDYHELGPTYLDRIEQRRTAGHLTRRLRDLGYHLQITPKAAYGVWESMASLVAEK